MSAKLRQRKCRTDGRTAAPCCIYYWLIQSRETLISQLIWIDYYSSLICCSNIFVNNLAIAQKYSCDIMEFRKVVRDVRYQKMTRQVGAFFFIKPWSSIESFRHSFVCLSVCVCVSFNMFFVFVNNFFLYGRHKRCARSRKKKKLKKKKTQWKTHVWNADSMKKTSWGCKLRNMEAKKYKKGEKQEVQQYETNESREKRNAVQQLLYILFIF